MKRKLNEGLKETLQEMGRPTTPEQLQKRGVRRLRSVGMKEISLLIEKAVNRAVMNSVRGVSAQEVQRMIRIAQGDFYDQLKTIQKLEDSRQAVEDHRRMIQTELARLRRKLQGRDASVEARASAATMEAPVPDEEPLSAQWMSQTREALGKILAGFADEGTPREETLAHLVAFVRVQRAEARERTKREFDRDFDKLERRIDKLVDSLEDTEAALKIVWQNGGYGLGSTYKTVQGLSEDAAYFGLKRQLLFSIYEANLTLQEGILHRGGGHGDASTPIAEPA